MASQQPPNPPTGNNNEKAPEPAASSSSEAPQDAMDTAPDQPAEETWADIPEEIMSLSTDEILTRIRLIDNDLKVRSMSLAAALSSKSYAFR